MTSFTQFVAATSVIFCTEPFSIKELGSVYPLGFQFMSFAKILLWVKARWSCVEMLQSSAEENHKDIMDLWGHRI